MMEFAIALNWFGAIGCGVMAGVYFTFSTFVMRALAVIDPASGIKAMQSINIVIQTSLFLPLFFGTSLAALTAAAVSFLADEVPGDHWMTLAGVTYFVGMFICTVALNVPLNNRLDAVDPKSKEGEAVWDMYVEKWTLRNHVRTVASTLSVVFFVLALVD